MSDAPTLSQLQGAEEKEKKIEPEDRRALNEELLDRATIDQLHKAGKSSQEKRKESRRLRDAQHGSPILFVWFTCRVCL